MEKPEEVSPNQKIKVAINSKWGEITESETKEILHNHDKLTDILNYRYSMSKQDAQKEVATFFKPFEVRSTGA